MNDLVPHNPFHDHKPLRRVTDTSMSGGGYPQEPPPGSVVSFKARLPGSDKLYDYAAIRAGDGRWWLTGGETKQGVMWSTLLDNIRPVIEGPLWLTTDRKGYLLR